ncbi:uncharacterized protein LOC119668771 [Teleopsis dalmanni]|uniref:uncharacterized protein LOC119668771 n=1 Tax=Teleopsis dalmanni TaxID=139649 RepID=UPI0018CCAFBA|nr:uncharacterized protein LOC119668771 [Teleopsis dalmanni]
MSGEEKAVDVSKAIENIEDIGACARRLSTSRITTMSNESDVSFNLSFDAEIAEMDSDELPAFDIRLLSPHGSSPSPIDKSMEQTISKDKETSFSDSPCHNNPEFIALRDINAQISPPLENDVSSLETIYEGVFLNTPTRKHNVKPNMRNERCRRSLQEVAVTNGQQLGKENNTPIVHQSPRRSDLIEPSYNQGSTYK